MARLATLLLKLKAGRGVGAGLERAGLRLRAVARPALVVHGAVAGDGTQPRLRGLVEAERPRTGRQGEHDGPPRWREDAAAPERGVDQRRLSLSREGAHRRIPCRHRLAVD